MAVISQRLIPTKDSKGRVAALEIMPVSGTIRDCIRDSSRMDDIYDLIEEGGQSYGSQSFDQHLMALVRAGTIDFRVAMAAANNPTDFDLKMNTFAPGGDTAGAGAPQQGYGDEMSRLFGTS
jgi:twitching motility protein PilT